LTETLHWVISLFDWRFFAIFVPLVALALILPTSYIKPFRSVRFNVYLFFVIAILSSVGTFIPQNKPVHDALAKFGPFWGDLFQKIGFLDIYHTWYFACVLALMAFDVVACKLRGLPKMMHRKPKPPPHNAAFSAHHSLDDSAARLTAWFSAKRLSVTQEKAPKGEKVFVAARHGFQRWGDFILHVSIVGVLAGNLLGALRGFEEILPIMEGSSYRMKNRPYDVTLKDFDIEYYESTGAPSLYASDIVVTENGQVIGQKRIIVNDPLDIHRVRFYQASWGMTDEFRSARLHVAGAVLELKPREVTPIPHTPLSIRANAFYPTFDIDADGRAITRDFEGKNPAVQVDFLEKDELKVRLWLLKNQPELAFQVTDGRVIPAKAPPPFFLLDVDPILFSGIQVGYDPGAPIFWFFAVILLFGLCLHFYMHERRIRVTLESHGKSTRVAIHGWNSRTPDDFRSEFEDWTAEIKNVLGE
jgi:cytochrome c biogenesis protein